MHEAPDPRREKAGHTAPGQEPTVRFRVEEEPVKEKAARVLREVHAALVEKGYNPTSQLVGYFLSGDPTYITSHRNARSLIRTLERDELLEAIVEHFLRCPHTASRP